MCGLGQQIKPYWLDPMFWLDGWLVGLVGLVACFQKKELNVAEIVQQENALKKEDKLDTAVTMGFFNDQQHAKPFFCSLKSNAP